MRYLSELEIKELIEKVKAKYFAGKYKNVLSIVKKIEESEQSSELGKEYLVWYGLALFKLKKYYEAVVNTSYLFKEVPLKSELLANLKEVLTHVKIQEVLVSNLSTGSGRNKILDLIESLRNNLAKGKLLLLFYVSRDYPKSEVMAYLLSELASALPHDNQFLKEEMARIVRNSLRNSSIFMKKQDYEYAIFEFNKVLYIRPNYVHALTSKGLCHFMQEEYEEAKKSMNFALKLEPNNQLGKKYINLIEKQSEIRDKVPLSEVEKRDKTLDPKSKRLNDKGADLLSLRKLEEGLKCFQEALSVDPNNFRALTNMGAIYTLRNQLEKAMESYQRALKLFPNYEDALFGIGSVSMLQKEFDTALKYFDQILESNPNHMKSMFSKAFVFKLTQKFEEAIHIYDEILLKNPNNWDAQKLRKIAEFELTGMTGKVLDDAIDKDKEEYFITEEGFQLLTEGRFTEALDKFNKAIAVNPRYHLSWAHKGFVLMDLNNYEESIKSFKKALELDPSSLYARNNLGISLRKLGKVEDAIIQFKKSIDLNSQQFEAWYSLGNAHMDRLDYLEALYCYDQALAIDPTKLNAQNNKRIAEKNLSHKNVLIRMSGPDKNGLLGTPGDEGDGEYKLITGKNREDLANKIWAENRKYDLRQMKDILPSSFFEGILEGDTFMEELKKERESRNVPLVEPKGTSLYSKEQVQFNDIEFPQKLQETIEKNDWKESLRISFELLKNYSVSQLILLQSVINSSRKLDPNVKHFDKIVDHYMLLLDDKPHGKNNLKRFIREIVKDLRRFRVDGIIHFDYDESRKISGRVEFTNFPVHIYAIILKSLLKKKPSV